MCRVRPNELQNGAHVRNQVCLLCSAPKMRYNMLDPSRYPTKKYLHFDHRVNIERVKSYVTSPTRIARHSFLPLIHYVSSFEKNIGEKNIDFDNRPIKSKDRDIMYAGHLDGHIYKHYSELLNDYYNTFCNRKKIDECVTAYRNNKPKQSNIDFAADVINTIMEMEKAFILVGDFTHYFDKIDHSILKNNLKNVLNVKRLDSDWYNVYRSITKYGYYNKEFIESMVGNEKILKQRGAISFFNQLSDFREFQKNNKVEYNHNCYGIPQGCAISAVFANVYALNFDLSLKKIANEYNGIYRRYSDDFILVLPEKNNTDQMMMSIEKNVRKIASTQNIEIQEEKTAIYKSEFHKITNLTSNETDHLDYLGFVFDGSTVRMRGKSPYKFYRRAKILIGISKSVKSKKRLDKLPYRKSIYKLYTDLGESKAGRFSFIDYAKKAQRKFDLISPKTQNLMMTQIKNRKKKIEKMLGIKIHTKK